MTREEAKKLLPILQAFAEGKTIEVKTKEGSQWTTLEEDDIDYLDFKKCDFRIKPKPTYRPFANAEECWNEMLKHQPFGWVILKALQIKRNIVEVGDFIATVVEGEMPDYQEAFDNFTFADGSVFGVKVKEG